MTDRSVREFRSALKRETERLLNSIADGAKKDIRDIVIHRIRTSPTAISLISENGQLRRDFGLSRSAGNKALSFITNVIAQNIKVDIKTIGNGASTRVEMSIAILAANVSELLESQYTNYVSPKSGELISWLEWLLTQGTSVIINDHKVVSRDGGRSGLGVMVEGGDFRVEPQHSGTKRDNFITRAVISGKDEIVQSLRNRIKRNIS